jgi:hypothetical protein
MEIRSGARAVCGLERGAATATARTHGISNPEARTGQTVFVVDGAVAKPSKARGINKESRPVSFHDEVIGLWRADCHRVLHAGTSPFFDRKAESRRACVETPLFDKHAEVRGRVGSEFDHISLLGMICDEVKFVRAQSAEMPFRTGGNEGEEPVPPGQRPPAAFCGILVVFAAAASNVRQDIR